jgi:hypothetical protein
MAFLNDLNPLSIAATVITLTVCGCAIFLDMRDWLNRWRIDGRRQFALLIWTAPACALGAFIAYSPGADAPRKTVIGDYREVGAISGHGVRIDFICVDDCAATGGRTLAIGEKSLKVLRKGPVGRRYEFEFLDRPSGNALWGSSLRVVGIRDPDSGAKLYEVDLTRHWGRMLLFIADFLLCVCTGVLCVVLKLGGKRRNRDDQEEPESKPKSSLITNLDLS